MAPLRAVCTALSQKRQRKDVTSHTYKPRTHTSVGTTAYSMRSNTLWCVLRSTALAWRRHRRRGSRCRTRCTFGTCGSQQLWPNTYQAKANVTAYHCTGTDTVRVQRCNPVQHASTQHAATQNNIIQSVQPTRVPTRCACSAAAGVRAQPVNGYGCAVRQLLLSCNWGLTCGRNDDGWSTCVLWVVFRSEW